MGTEWVVTKNSTSYKENDVGVTMFCPRSYHVSWLAVSGIGDSCDENY